MEQMKEKYIPEKITSTSTNNRAEKGGFLLFTIHFRHNLHASSIFSLNATTLLLILRIFYLCTRYFSVREKLIYAQICLRFLSISVGTDG